MKSKGKYGASKEDYAFCKQNYYSIGINIVEREAFLIASPEKALCNLMAYTPKLRPRFVKSLKIFLEDDLRLDMDQFYKMDPQLFIECALHSKKKNEIKNLIKLLQNKRI